MAICPAAAGRTGSAPGDSPPAWLTAQPCASLLRDSLHRHLGCVMSEPEAGPAARRQRRYTTPVELLPTVGTAALRPTTRTLGHRRLNSYIAVLYGECPHPPQTEAMFRRRGGPGCSARLGRLRARRGDRVESKAVIDGTSLSGTMLQDRFAFSSAHQGAPRSQGARNPRAGRPC